MLVYSNWKLPVYQVIGPVVRVHWDYSSELTEEGESWAAEEAVVPLDADEETFISLVNAEGGDGEALAEGWFNV